MASAAAVSYAMVMGVVSFEGQGLAGSGWRWCAGPGSVLGQNGGSSAGSAAAAAGAAAAGVLH